MRILILILGFKGLTMVKDTRVSKSAGSGGEGSGGPLLSPRATFQRRMT